MNIHVSTASTIALIIFLIWSGPLMAQCNIVADSTGCRDEPVGFSVLPANASVISWDFGDGTSGNQQNPLHKYSSTGNHKVAVLVRMPNGSTCTTDHFINIHAPPVPDILIAQESEYCLSKNKLCLIDSVKNGLTNTPVTRRIILWGDGGSTSQSTPYPGEKICYTYNRVDSLKITVEWTNKVGCKALQELDVRIKPDYLPSFHPISTELSCDTAILCFENDSLAKSSEIVTFEWNFGYGFSDTFPWVTACFTYDSAGRYPITLRTRLRNGCVNEFTRNTNVFIPELKFNLDPTASFKCYPAQFFYEQEDIPGLEYQWKLYDTSMKLIDSFGIAHTSIIIPPRPGKFLVVLTLSSGHCEESRVVDTITTAGVLADFDLLNRNQCENRDTVYACNKTLKFGTDSVIYFWNFGDPDPDTRCTTDKYQGINLDKNCNWVLGEDAKHKYANEGCPNVRLVAYDLKNGCIDSVNSTAIINHPDAVDFNYIVDRKCIGMEPEYKFTFRDSECLGDLLINYDSACSKDRFTLFNPWHYYLKSCDTSGWVTVGLATMVGSAKVYRSCDTSDYYIDSLRLCMDTLWKSHWFRLSEPPVPDFSYEVEDCIPATIKTSLNFPVQKNVRFIKWMWGDGSVTTIPVDGSSDSLPGSEHVYSSAGKYTVTLYLETDSGCFSTESVPVKAGYFNDFSMDTVICPGQELQIIDFLYYFDDGRPYWRDPQRAKDSLETLIWDFDDGRGFQVTGPLPSISYPKEGRYLIRMASKDKNGCTDTAEHYLTVTGVIAEIANKDKELICNDIIQFFDSSWMPGNYDSIEKWYWDFGDGKTPSFLKDPFHFYSSYGEFTVRLIVETFAGCLDTAFYPIEINGPKPFFEILSDTVGCVPYTVEFDNLSENVSDYIWYFGDHQNTTLSTKSDSNVSFTYTIPGIYYIYLWGSDSVVNKDNDNIIYYCKATFPDTVSANPVIRRVVILPVPEAGFEMDSMICTSSPVKLTDRSESIYQTYRWYISNGDSIISSNKEVTYEFKEPGTYTVRYLPLYTPEGPYERPCYDSATYEVTVYHPFVDFEMEKDGDCPVYHFTDKSANAVNVHWDFGTNVSGNRYDKGTKVSYNFSLDSGEHTICLYIKDHNSCMDTACETIFSDYQFRILIPNIFTPQGDGFNDEYDIDILNEGFYNLKIYNRWGELVYEQNEDADYRNGINWNGNFSNSGEACPDGTYFYIFRFSNRCLGKIKTVEGTVTLLR